MDPAVSVRFAQNWRFTSINTTHKGAIHYLHFRISRIPVLVLNNNRSFIVSTSSKQKLMNNSGSFILSTSNKANSQ